MKEVAQRTWEIRYGKTWNMQKGGMVERASGGGGGSTKPTEEEGIVEEDGGGLVALAAEEAGLGAGGGAVDGLDAEDEDGERGSLTRTQE